MVSSGSKRLLAFALLASALPVHAGELKGRILVGEKPMPGVTVTAVPYESPWAEARRQVRNSPAPAPLISATSGPNGSFVLTVLTASQDRARPEQDFQIRLEGGGIAATLLDGIYGSAESAELGEQTIARGEPLAGRVVDDSGAPVSDAEVTLVGGSDRLEDAGLLRARVVTSTGADGAFRLEGATAAGNTVSIQKQGFAPVRLTGLRGGGVSRAVVLRRGTAISGTVRASDRKSPAKGTLVRYEGLADTRWVEVGEDGTFALPNAPGGGRGRLVAEGGDAGSAEVGALTLPLVPDRKLNLVLVVPASIEGRVVDAKTGRGVPRTKVRLRAGNSVLIARSGPDGKYRLHPLLPTRYALRADEARYVPYHKSEFPLSPGEAKKLDIALTLGATLSGRVTDESGAPVVGAKGRLARGGETGVAALMRQARTADPVAFRSGPDGTFRAARLSPGDNLRLTVAHPDFESATLAGLALPAGGVKANVAVLLLRGHSISGHVRDGEGNPIAGADIELGGDVPAFRGGRGGMRAAVSVGRGPADRPHEKSGADGRFLVRGVSSGEYFLSVKKPGFATERLEPLKVGVESPAPVVVTLSPGASIGGFVKGKSGNGVEGYRVFTATPGRGMGMGAMSGLTDLEPTGPDGAFLVEGLKAGQTYDLQPYGAEGPGPQKRGIVAPANGVEIVVSGSGRIAGVALDAKTGSPIPDYSVSYEPDRGGGMGAIFRIVNRETGRRMSGIGEREAVHQEDGKFILEKVPAGTWQVVVEAKGYQTAHVGSIVVEEGATKENVEVRATAGGTLKGRVSDAGSGRAIPGAAITTAAGTGGGMQALLALGGGESEVTTDADGRFEIEGLAIGKLRVTARHEDYTDATESVELREGGANVELHLSTGGVLAGTVFSDGQQGVAGVDVDLAPAGESGLGRMGFGAGAQATVTDTTGRFRFEHLNAGRYTVTASLRSATSAPADVVLQAGESKEDVALTLASGTTIRGVVSGLPDEQRAGVNVSASGPEGDFASSRTGADGRFELTGAPIGSILLQAQAGDPLGSTRSATKQVTTTEGTPVLETEIVFEPGFLLSGRVSKGGNPVSDGTVYANQQGSGRSASARTDEAGSYRLEGLAPGTYNVRVMSGMFGRSTKGETVTLSSDQTLDLEFPSARIAGNVVESGTHQPLADTTVNFSGGPVASGGGAFLRAITTDSNGHFSQEDLESKSYTLTVRKSDYLLEKRDVTAAESGTDQLTIELTRGEGIGIQARDGLYNIPLRGLLVRVLDGQKSTVFMGSIALDSEGRGDIPSLKPGLYSLLANASGYAPVSVDSVSVPSQTVPIALTPGGSLEIRSGPKTLAGGSGTMGRFLTAAGVSYSYSLFSSGGQIVLSSPVRRLENFAAGSYVLALNGGDSRPFTVSEGGTTLVELP